jgi:recombination protein RecR
MRITSIMAGPSKRQPDSPAPSWSSTSGYPAAVAKLIDQLSALPGIGRRSAERLALHLLKAPPDTALALAKAVQDIKTSVRNCSICANVTENPVCSICLNPKRDASTVLVVEQPRDVLAIESTGMYQGVYHVLLGRLSPLEGIGPQDLTIADLLERVSHPQSKNPRATPVSEVILGLNPTLEGDGTTLFLTDAINQLATKKNAPIRVTRLARGLPVGMTIEQTNKLVLSEALTGRHRA